MTIALDSPVPSESLRAAPASTAARIVQLPTDVERSAARVVEVAVSSSVETELPLGKRESDRRAVLLAAVIALLHRYTEQTVIALDVFIGDEPGEVAVGIDVDVAGDVPVAALVDNTRRALSQGASRPAAIASNVAVSFVSESFSAEIATSRAHEVHFVFARRGEEYFVVIGYNANLLTAASVERLMAAYAVLAKEVIAAPSTVIERLPLLTPAGVATLTKVQDSGVVAYGELPFCRIFEEVAGARPTAIAVSHRGSSLTYAELDRQSNRLARHLLERGAGLETVVAVCVKPSTDILIAMLAIWKARGVYLPLDPTHPPALIARVIEEAKPKLVLTTSDLGELTSPCPRFCFDRDAALLEALAAEAPATRATLDDWAYVFYTSGTTGKPKGVLATQRNLSQYLHSAAELYRFSPDDVFASLARYTFSISLFELLSPIRCGGRLRILDRDEVLTPERLCRALDEITVLHAGPSLLGSLFRYLHATPSARSEFPRMRHASSGGDMVSPLIMEGMKRAFPNAETFVIYGCTEVSCMGTTYPIPRAAKARRSFVGKAFPNVIARVFDARGRLVPFGVVGEICFAGDGVVRGYLHRPELDAEKFVDVEGRRFYRTGDMGRLHPNGDLEILGRRDFQVQLRGIRIELAGIEKTVQELGLAAQCAVVAKTADDGDLRLVAFVVKPTRVDIASFRRALGAELPDYMLPHQVVVIEAMPLTINGKLDRNRLREMPWQAQLGGGDLVAAANEREKKVADVFARVLGVQSVSVTQSFFDLGGDSLLGVAALEEIKGALGVAIPPHVLFEDGTARAIASHGRDVPITTPRPILLNDESGPPLFMLSGVHIYRSLARRLEGGYSVYGLFTRREVEEQDPNAAFASVEDLAREYVDMIRRVQPFGPYRLLGYSFAGLVAYEAARQLREDGHEIPFLGLVDSTLPEWALGWRYRILQMSRLRSAPTRDVLAFLSRRIRRKPGSSELKFLRYQNDPKLGPLELSRNNANRGAAEQYMLRVRPFNGDVTLITSGERLHEDPLKSPSCGWAPYVSKLSVHFVEADHFRMLSDEPYVTQMAEILSARLKLAEA